MTKNHITNNNLITVVVVILVVLMFLGLFGFGFRSYGMMGGYPNGYMFGGIFSVLIIILIIAGIYWFIKNSNRNKS